MSIFIGKNDCGKSCVLRSLNIFLNNRPMTPDMFYELNGKRENISNIKLTFEVNADKFNDIPKDYIIDNSVTINKEFSFDGSNGVATKVLINKYIFKCTNLNSLQTLKASELKQICQDFGLEYTNVNQAREDLLEYVLKNFDDIPKDVGWSEIKWSDVSEFLPTFEYYDSSTYGNPQKLVEGTLAEVYRSFFYDYDEEGNSTLKGDLVKKRNEIRDELDKKINDSLYTKIKDIIDKVESISGVHDIDFASGYQLSNLLIDYGAGPHPINNIGEGSKKRLFLAITEWDKEIKTKGKHRMILRGYDEPDASLHYSAQKDMFYTLENLSKDPTAKVQVIICTHSLSMIDRAPARVINHVLQDSGISHIEFLEDYGEEEIKEFLDNVSEISGIKNSSIFFERCFLIVEGPTEANALPIIYKNRTGRSLTEDGVVLEKLEGNAAWSPFLKLLNKNKSRSTILFLDKDTQNDPSRCITQDRLSLIGFSSEYIGTNVLFAGSKEFEDIFSDELISKCLNMHWPKADGEIWYPSEINGLRTERKFSDSLQGIVAKYKQEHSADYDYLRKPEFGKRIAELIDLDIIDPEDPAHVLLDLIDKIQEIVR